ncbi:MAG: hypothetical protein IT350_08310 [Deltaproteobacteria bacterium]|nr:hypothetical protein [Deltaproteobacteria bacterium]
MRGPGEVRPREPRLPVQFEVNDLHARKFPHQRRLRRVDVLLVEPPLQIDLQTQREEARDDVADPRVVVVMKQRPEFQR